MTDATNNSEGGHLSTRYWPATFEERGVVAPFTTPTLAFSRVRSDQRDGLEILIPGMSGGSGVYVIAWPAVREVFRMTVHDRALHEGIRDAKATTPRMMRRCANQTAMTGLAGPDSLECSKVALEQEDNERLLTNFYLINSVVDRLLPTPASLTVAELSSPQGQRKARKILDEIADGLGASSEQIYRCLEVWSDLIAPLGLSMMPHECRLRRLMKPAGGIPHERERVEPALQRRSQRAVAARRRRREAYTRRRSPGDRRGRCLCQRPRPDPDRLSWLLDGWEHVLTIWDGVLEAAIWEQVEAMEEIVRMLPLVPKK